MRSALLASWATDGLSAHEAHRARGTAGVRPSSAGSKCLGIMLHHGHVSPRSGTTKLGRRGQPCGLKIGKRESQKCTLNRKQRFSHPVHRSAAVGGESFALDVCCLDNWPPLIDLGLLECAKPLWCLQRAPGNLLAKVGEPLF